MKIGAVSQETGLTDRTIRYYIEEGLLQPEFTKNYTGRKSFDFTQAHVTLLQQISVLRKYGFSITDIKTILEDPTQSSEITRELIDKKRQTIQTEQILLDTLLRLDKQKDYTLPELAEALDSPVLADVKPPKDYGASGLIALFWIFCILEIAVGILISINIVVDWHKQFLYIRFYPLTVKTVWGFIRYMYPLICAGIMWTLYTDRFRKKRILHTVLTYTISIVYLITWFPLGIAVGINPIPPIYSETHSIQNYLQVGSIEKILYPLRIYSQKKSQRTHCPKTVHSYQTQPATTTSQRCSMKHGMSCMLSGSFHRKNWKQRKRVFSKPSQTRKSMWKKMKNGPAGCFPIIRKTVLIFCAQRWKVAAHRHIIGMTVPVLRFGNGMVLSAILILIPSTILEYLFSPNWIGAKDHIVGEARPSPTNGYALG